VLEVLDAVAARRWAVLVLADLGQAREEIDALNVYPVPDGDTGTNLYLTLEAALAGVQLVPDTAALPELCDAFARACLRGARGNSGVIVAQLLRGLADVAAERQVLDGAGLAEALDRADAQAWAAVGRPVEGTILSVSRAAATAAKAATGSLTGVVGAASRAAAEALARTPYQLEQLRRAGVVDAGGRGYLVLIEALEAVVAGRIDRARRSRRARPSTLPAVDLSQCDQLAADGPAYEVMYLLEASADDAVAGLRERLARLGDSVVVVGGGGLWHVHVHVDLPGAAIEAGIEAGRPHEIRVVHFAEQIERARSGPRAGTGLVACAAGPGLAELFAGAGAEVVQGGAGRRPSTRQLLEAVRRTGAGAVVVLPNDGDTLAVAEAAAAAARQQGIRVTVLPTRAQVQGLAAAAVHDPARSTDDDVVRMSAAAGATRDGAVTVAAREAFTTAGLCRPGDVLGVLDGDFALIGEQLAEVAIQVVDRLLSGGGELVTLVTGEDAEPALAEAVAGHLRRSRRDVEVCVLDGGQPRYPLLIGVE
jgi:uncharacterized protein